MKNGERFLLGSQICLYLWTKGITIMGRPLYLQGIVAFNRILGAYNIIGCLTGYPIKIWTRRKRVSSDQQFNKRRLLIERAAHRKKKKKKTYCDLLSNVARCRSTRTMIRVNGRTVWDTNANIQNGPREIVWCGGGWIEQFLRGVSWFVCMLL